METFLRPKLIGKRFDNHSLPLDLIKDFSAFEEMVIEIAKRKYLSEFPERKRLPKGFGKDISIHLTAIEEGSVILSLIFSSNLSIATLESSKEVPYLNKAKDTIIQTIASVEQGQEVLLDPVLLRYFDRLGRSLRSDESIEFSDSDNKATLNPNIRTKLLEISKVKSWSENLTLRGYVSAVDKSNQAFEMQLLNSSKVKINYEEQFQMDILEAFEGYEKKTLLEVKGVAILDRANSIKSFGTLEQVSLLDPLNIEVRLEELCLLGNGWLDGKGKALNKEQAQHFSELFDSHFSPNLPLPYLYPTAEGGLLAEWKLYNWDISLEIELENLSSELHALNLESNEEREQSFMLEEPNAWSQMNEILESLNKE